MNCTFEIIDGKPICPRCGYKIKSPGVSFVHKRCLLPGETFKRYPDGRPGYEMEQLMDSLGQVDNGSCGCAAFARQMDNWGVSGCREHRGEIINKLKESAKTLTWFDAMTVACKLIQEPWFNPLDRYGSLADESIRRAEIKKAEPQPEPPKSVWDQYTSC